MYQYLAFLSYLEIFNKYLHYFYFLWISACSNIKTNPGSQLALFVRVFSSYYWKILSYAYNVYILHWISWIPSVKVILIFCHHGYAIQTACVYSCWPSPPSPCNCLQRLGERGKVSQFGIYFSFLQMPPNLFIIHINSLNCKHFLVICIPKMALFYPTVISCIPLLLYLLFIL